MIVLVTDGEDLEGDPVAVARSASEEKTRIDVVQNPNRWDRLWARATAAFLGRRGTRAPALGLAE